MQTFLPYASFSRSAEALDARRLGKQRVEALQVLRALHLEDYGWTNHPAVLMWRGHTRALAAYGLAVVEEWCARGNGDSTREQITEFFAPGGEVDQAGLSPGESPPWLGSRPLHRSHRSALVRKDPSFYGPRFPRTPPDLPYVWPGAPTDPERPLPHSGWVVRAAGSAQGEAFRQGGFVGVPSELARPAATPKQRHGLARFLDGMAVGDRVALLDPGQPGEILVGRITGGARAARSQRVPAGTGALAASREVRWSGGVPRTTLLRPYQLQDPQWVFRLRGEPAVEAVRPVRA